MSSDGKKSKAGEIWAVALSDDGRYMASTSANGRIAVWDLDAPPATEASGVEGGAGSAGGVRRAREYETKCSFGMSVAIVSPIPIPHLH